MKKNSDKLYIPKSYKNKEIKKNMKNFNVGDRVVMEWGEEGTITNILIDDPENGSCIVIRDDKTPAGCIALLPNEIKKIK